MSAFHITSTAPRFTVSDKKCRLVMLTLESCDNKTPQRADSPAAEVHSKKTLFKSSADQLNSEMIFAITTHKRHLSITEQHCSVLLWLSLGEEGDNALLKTLFLNTLTLPTASHQFPGLPFSLCLNSAAQMPKQRHALVTFINCKKLAGFFVFCFLFGVQNFYAHRSWNCDYTWIIFSHLSVTLKRELCEVISKH